MGGMGDGAASGSGPILAEKYAHLNQSSGSALQGFAALSSKFSMFGSRADRHGQTALLAYYVKLKENSPMDIRRTASLAGLIGPVLFVAVFLGEGWLRPGYDPLSSYVSALSLGPRGFVQVSNFLFFGTCLLCFARGVAAAMPNGPASRSGTIMLAIIALGYLLAGPFVMDPPGTPPYAMSWHGIIHGVLGGIVFTFMPIVCFVFLRRFARDANWRWFRMGTWFAGLVTAAAVVLLSAGTKAPALIDAFAPWDGLIQRAAVIPFMAWVFAFALGLRTKP
jgi:Protein of unknown function (DUF998)